MQHYAPLYNTRERVRLSLITLAWVVPLIAAGQLLFLPWLRGYAALAHCQDYGVFTGVQALFYGVCVGLPLLFAVTLLAVMGRRSLRIIRLGQCPLPHEKVLRPTPYRYGFRARLMGYIPLALIAAMLALSVHGCSVANQIIERVPHASHAPDCAKT
ncbi:MAG: hypothetical protein V4812_13765 [Pseudomonadota bacterium]